MTSPTLDAAKVAASRLWAATELPYLASALFACTVQAAPESAAVTIDRGWRVRADPAVVDELSAHDLGRLLVHLVNHVLRDHAGRAHALRVDESQAAWWNTCADAEINDDLYEAGNLPPLVCTLPADLGQHDGRLVEHYYDQPYRSRDDPTYAQESRPHSCGSGADGIPRPGEGDEGGLGERDAQLVRTGTAEQIRAAEQQRPGSVAGGWLRWAESVLPSRVDWRRILAAEIRRALGAVAGQVDYTYRRPSRRHHTPVAAQTRRPVMPSLFRPVPNVAVVCDTSGSMDDELLAVVLAEIDGILTRGGLRTVGLAALSVDTEVQSAQRVNRAAQVALLGGGGTDMAAGIEAAAARRPRPELIIVLTDGYTPWPDHPPAGARVVVAVVDGGPVDDVPPWARAVSIDEA